MYLTKIELNGFKSFPDKTAFEFASGITAILGPNGCGKSNVVDAVKWVLGESRPKALRSEQMVDVIFAGSERRRPSGLAEVSLSFDNSDSRLPIDYNEVCITRRLYRSGESEYFINKQPCRRRDIRDLFMDTGIGTSAYSFIEQGKVEALLHAKPAERRAVFEEAAGISKYKARRKETLARLERTNQYLLRVNDIVEEKERAIRRVARQAATARRYQRLQTELDELQTQHFVRQFQQLREQLEKVRRERGEIDALLVQESARQAELTRQITELTNQEIGSAQKLETHEQAVAEVQESLRATQVEFAGTAERLAALQRENEASRERTRGARAGLDRLKNEELQSAAALLACRGDMAELNEAIQGGESERTHREEAERRARELTGLRAERAAKASRGTALKDLEINLAGAQAGVKAVLAAWKEGRDDCGEVEGMVAELLSVSGELALAIETSLGAKSQNIVVRTAHGAQRCIEYLKRNQAGRCTFLPLDSLRPRRSLSHDLSGLAGVVGEAIDLVRFAPQYRVAMECLLAGTLVVETLARARELAANEARGIRMVTLTGEVMHPSGAMTGGHGRQARSGFIARKAEIEKMTVELAEIDTRLTTVTAARDQAIKAARAAAGAQPASPEEAPAGRTGLEAETALDSGREAGSGEVAPPDDTRAALDRLNHELGGLREKRAEVQAHARELESRLQSLAADKEERQRLLESSQAFCTRTSAEEDSLGERQEALRSREADLLTRRDTVREAGVELRQSCADLRARLKEERENERAAQARASRIMEAQHKLKLKENEFRIKTDALAEKARDELQVTDLPQRAEVFVREKAAGPAADALNSSEDLPAGESAAGESTDGESADGEAEAPAEASVVLARLSDAEIAARVEELTAKIDRLGPVNLYAIEELSELEAQVEFQQSQREDLLAAVGDLHQLIERLNQECQVRFDETFATVRENFREMFRKLFGGGKADLIMEEIDPETGGDQLEAGIDIIARPPGKEPTSISLLSGGEKALCAVALLFAIFQSKPSPFCILDEVDGPLDESNIDRFMNAVREFAQDTQFILISHAKRTMSMTDRIYGITQDEPGVSKKYSLEFKTLERSAEPEPVAASPAAG